MPRVFLGNGTLATEKPIYRSIAVSMSSHACAVRTSKWCFVNNKELYDIKNDPSETKDVSVQYPEVIAKLRKSYDLWWASALLLMVNEDLPRVKEHPLHLRYEKQEKEQGIPDWKPADYRSSQKHMI